MEAMKSPQQLHLSKVHASMRARVAKEKAKLDRRVMAWRAPVDQGGEGLTYARIAARLGVTPARAWQIVRQAQRRQGWRE